MVNTKIRPGKRFLELRNNMKRSLSGIYGRPVSDSMLTDGIADFMRDEGLDEVFIRRAKYRRRRGGFL